MSKKIYVGNLPFKASSNLVDKLFSDRAIRVLNGKSVQGRKIVLRPA